MTCIMCKNGETKPGFTTVTHQRDGAVVVVRNVPGEICTQCGEYYLEDSVVAQLETIVERAFEGGTEVAIVRYAA